VDWKEKILSEEQKQPQKLMLAGMAIAQIEDAIRKLGSMGHYIHVREGVVEVESWPRFVWNRFGYSRIVRCQADLVELGPDWHDSLDAARKAYGMDKQMERGGVFRNTLPDIIRSPLSKPSPNLPKPSLARPNGHLVEGERDGRGE
jgi:hypothetical protein